MRGVKMWRTGFNWLRITVRGGVLIFKWILKLCKQLYETNCFSRNSLFYGVNVVIWCGQSQIKFVYTNLYILDYSGRAVYGMNCLRPLERWDRRFESDSRHGCLSVFILYLYRQRPCDGLIPRPRNPTDCRRIKKLRGNKYSKKPCEIQQLCAAIWRKAYHVYFFYSERYLFSSHHIITRNVMNM
jgi:hypothetical protein